MRLNAGAGGGRSNGLARRDIACGCAAVAAAVLVWLCGTQLTEDLLANAIALKDLLVGADEILLSLSATPAGAFVGTLRSAAPGLVVFLGGVIVVSAVTPRRRVSLDSMLRRSVVLFVGRREKRADTLHYSSENFWLRIRGR